jgi:ketosteroid isomerase-like protein
VLSEDALKRIATIDREQIERRIRLLFEHWQFGDIDSIIHWLAPDITFPANGSWTGLEPPMRGREQAAARLRKYANTLESIVNVLHEIVIDGDRAVVHRTSVGRWRSSGRRYQCDFIDFMRFRDGLVVEFSEYPDAAWSKAEAMA